MLIRGLTMKRALVPLDTDSGRVACALILGTGLAMISLLTNVL
jgi:hypothetical protein